MKPNNILTDEDIEKEFEKLAAIQKEKIIDYEKMKEDFDKKYIERSWGIETE